jgi:uncharacterized membrane-anchored protein
VGKLGNLAEIEVPEGYLFTEKAGAQKLLELTHNIPNGNEVGALVPEGEEESEQWFVIFEFSETGYIKDDEKDELDADAILESIQEGTEKQNSVRREKGWPAFHVVGWEKAPYYDSRTNNLTWSIRGRDDVGIDSVNHSTRLLGRRGTMNVDLVVAPEQAAQAIPRVEQILTGFGYQQGHRYSDFISGDKVASYGLTALVAGGAGALAVKTGLLQKFWKVIVILLVAVGAALKRFFVRIFGKSQPEQESSIPPQG